jgi:cytochrome c oxidase assembly protein subunit 15
LSKTTQLACHLFLLMLIIQATLGITTLLNVVPIHLAAAHQGGALLLFAASLWVSHRLRKSA